MSETPYVDKFLKSLVTSQPGHAINLKSAFSLGAADAIAGEVLAFMRERWPEQTVSETLDGLQAASFWVQAMASAVDVPTTPRPPAPEADNA